MFVLRHTRSTPLSPSTTAAPRSVSSAEESEAVYRGLLLLLCSPCACL